MIGYAYVGLYVKLDLAPNIGEPKVFVTRAVKIAKIILIIIYNRWLNVWQ